MKKDKQPTSNAKIFEGIAIGLVAAFGGVVVFAAFFRQASLSGIVTDKTTDLPIPGVKVTLTGSEGTYLTTNTDVHGKYSFPLGGKTTYDFQGYQYIYYYSLDFQSAEYGEYTLQNIILHPANNNIDVFLEAI